MKPLMLALVVLITGLANAQQTFRSSAHAVVVDVSVFDGRRPVNGLTASDFEIVDDGVRQRVSLVSNDVAPLIIDLLADVSVSVVKRPVGTLYHYREADIRSWMDRIIRMTQQASSKNDQIRRFRFGSTVSLADEDSINRAMDLDDIERRSGRTSLLDAIATILMRQSDGHFRRVLLVITDGRDTASAIEENLLLDVAERSQGSIYLIAVGGREPHQLPGISRNPITTIDGYEWLLNELTDRTGGLMVKLSPKDDPATAFKAFTEQLRTRYLLTYEPEGVKAQGWHSLSVRVPGRNYDIRARRGYWRE